MLKKSPRPSKLLDQLHRGFVLTCAGLSAITLSYIGFSAYHYYFIRKPQRDSMLLKESEDSIAGDKYKMVDTAKTLS